MLELRPCCENCKKALPPNSEDAMICTFECTFCTTCVRELLHNVCPNCGGGFVRRPIRPRVLLEKYPATEKVVYKPVDMESFAKLLKEKQGIEPSER